MVERTQERERWSVAGLNWTLDCVAQAAWSAGGEGEALEALWAGLPDRHRKILQRLAFFPEVTWLRVDNLSELLCISLFLSVLSHPRATSLCGPLHI